MAALGAHGAVCRVGRVLRPRAADVHEAARRRLPPAVQTPVTLGEVERRRASLVAVQAAQLAAWVTRWEGERRREDC